MNKYLVTSLSSILVLSALAGCAPQGRKATANGIVKGGAPGADDGAAKAAAAAANAAKAKANQPGVTSPGIIPALHDLGLDPTKITFHANKQDHDSDVMRFNLVFNNDPSNVAEFSLSSANPTVHLDNATAVSSIKPDSTYACSDASVQKVFDCKEMIISLTLKNDAKPGASQAITITHSKIDGLAAQVKLLKGSVNLLGADEPVAEASQIINIIHTKSDKGDLVFQQFDIRRLPKVKAANDQAQGSVSTQLEGVRPLDGKTSVFVKILGSLGTDMAGLPLVPANKSGLLEMANIVPTSGNLISVKVPVVSGTDMLTLQFEIAPKSQIDSLAVAALKESEASDAAKHAKGAEAASEAAAKDAAESINKINQSGPDEQVPDLPIPAVGSAPAPAASTVVSTAPQPLSVKCIGNPKMIINKAGKVEYVGVREESLCIKQKEARAAGQKFYDKHQAAAAEQSAKDTAAELPL